MEPIISSEWIYWLTRADAIIVASIILSIIFGIFFIVSLFVLFDDCPYPDFGLILSSIILFILFAGCLCLCVFVPDSKTQIYMKIADNMTINNINWTMDQIKAAVDYVVESISKLK